MNVLQKIDIKYNKKFEKLPYHNKLHDICNQISVLLYNNVLWGVLGQAQNITKATVDLHENKEYIINIPNCAEKADDNVLLKLKYINRMVHHAKSRGILMVISK